MCISHAFEQLGGYFIYSFSLIVTGHSLARAKGEVFVLLYVFFVFLFNQQFPDNPRADLRQSLHAGVLSGCVFSPFVVSNPRQTEKRGNEIFVSIKVNGEFLHFGGFSDPHQILFV